MTRADDILYATYRAESSDDGCGDGSENLLYLTSPPLIAL